MPYPWICEEKERYRNDGKFAKLDALHCIAFWDLHLAVRIVGLNFRPANVGFLARLQRKLRT